MKGNSWGEEGRGKEEEKKEGTEEGVDDRRESKDGKA